MVEGQEAKTEEKEDELAEEKGDSEDLSMDCPPGGMGMKAEIQEEAERPKVRRQPKQPTKKEREEHECTHIPYRSWCTHCVRGRGRNTMHKTVKEGSEEEAMKVPRVVMDYFFLGDEKTKES